MDINIPDAPIFGEDLSTPTFIDASVIPAVNTDIDLPTLPAFNVQNFDAGQLPNSINLDGLLQSLDLSDLDLPPTPDAPILNLPDAPSITYVDVPIRPQIDDNVDMPDAPTIILPEMDVLEAIALPDFQYDEIPVFDVAPPELEVTIPDIDGIVGGVTKVVAEDYFKNNTDNAVEPLVLEIRSWLQGNHAGLGLPVAVEQSLFNRARERTSRETDRAVQEVVTDWASRGFSMPQGMLAKQVNDIRDNGKLAIADLNRDVLIRSFDK